MKKTSEYCYRILWDNQYMTSTQGDKIKKIYLLDLLNYKY